ncbi:endonuclease [Azospirillum sp. B506]|uniref:endonuclease/exonuclease/phosphatase family protein n=1 Tax=Azospirillum sp. B506 TaxID=137721 RepID=UPI000347497F|nr:endonuclease [Azospirillum sp. B506]
MIVSRWPIRATRLLRHHLVPPARVRLATADPAPEGETEVGWDRPVLHAEIEMPDGRILHVFDLHLRAPIAAPVPGQKAGAQTWKTASGWAEGFYLASIKRAGQALETRMAVDRLFDADPEALILVAGDCNADLEQTAVRIIRAAPDFTGNAELANRVLEPLEQAIPEERRYTVLHAGTPVLLDHLLASPRLAGLLREVAIHNEALTDEVDHADEPSPVSYHAPVVAAFSL